MHDKKKFLVLFIFLGSLLLPSLSTAQTETPDPAKTKPFVPVEKKDENAGALFKNAASSSEKSPDEAIRLYRRALQLKPDASEERRKFAMLLERQGKLNEAAGEYERLNSATGSLESFTDLIRVLEKTPLTSAAASVAVRGSMKFPENADLTIQAGELLLKDNRTDMALELLKRAVQKTPGNGKMIFLIGKAYEKKDMPADALRAYLKSSGNKEDSPELKDAVKRLSARAVAVDNIRVFLPKGRAGEKNTLINMVEQHRVVLQGHPSGDLNNIALKTAREQMPEGMFSAERLKGYEEIRKMNAEMAKSSPEIAEQMRNVPIPILATRPVAGKLNGIMTTASTGGEKMLAIRSVSVFAFQSGNKSYTMSMVTDGPYQECEKALLILLDYIVLPL